MSARKEPRPISPRQGKAVEWTDGPAITTVVAGRLAPSFTLPDQSGRMVSLAQLLARGPLVVVCFRALWCDHCRSDIAAVERTANLLRARGASIVGILRYSQEEAASLMDDTYVSFPLLNDQKGVVVGAFGLRSVLPAELAMAHASDWVTVPARFVVAPNGVVAYGDVDADYTRRPDPAELVPVITRIMTRT